LIKPLEEVIVNKLPQWAANQLVSKHSRTVVGADPHRKLAAAPEMPSLPGDLVAELEDTGHWPGNDSLVSVGGGLQMHIDAQRKVEAPLEGSGNQSRELDPTHCMKSRSSFGAKGPRRLFLGGV
jgi:hypothetical protein